MNNIFTCFLLENILFRFRFLMFCLLIKCEDVFFVFIFSLIFYKFFIFFLILKTNLLFETYFMYSFYFLIISSNKFIIFFFLNQNIKVCNIIINKSLLFQTFNFLFYQKNNIIIHNNIYKLICSLLKN